jgi:hypothetical protein
MLECVGVEEVDHIDWAKCFSHPLVTLMTCGLSMTWPRGATVGHTQPRERALLREGGQWTHRSSPSAESRGLRVR